MSAGFASLLERAAARRKLPPATNAYRLFNADGDGLPGVTVDWFDGVAVLSLYRPFPPAEESALADALWAQARPRAIYLKRRPREARVVATTRQAEVAPPDPIRGEKIPELVVQELGRSFLIRPGQGLSVGLYLDAREVRGYVAGTARERTVLNCFAYTCGFSVAARAGGAGRVVNVDVSRRVLDWGMENARLNDQPAEKGDYLAGDVFDWLARFGRKGQRFSMVILDPPSFSSTRERRFSAASDYPELAELAARVVDPGGLLVACCNLAGLPRERYERLVLKGVAAAGRQATGTERLGPSPIDFPVPRSEEPPLKVLVVSLA